MNIGKYVYAQIVEVLPQRFFDNLVMKYNGNKYVKHFTCWNQLLVMIFGQLTNRDSLRDLIVAIDAHSKKSYHLGFGKSVTRSNLSKANENRDYRIFEEFAYYLIDVARQKRNNSDFEIKGKVYAFDSTTIDLCLSVFWWAKFRKNKGGIKIHTLYDITTQIPVFIHITTASVNDMNAMDVIPYEVGAYYIFDRGYVDFTRLYKITQLDSYFVIRAKKNLQFDVSTSNEVDESTGVLSDQTGFLKGYFPSKYYPEKLRRVAFYDKDMNRTFIFLTNNFELSAVQIALLYKNRWQIELFFKWIKQHLKIKSFWGTSENAVRIQIYCAIIAYCIVTIVGHNLQIDRSTYEILQILGISLLDKTPINELFTNIDTSDVKEQNYKQLSLSLF
ncbi:transposase [uncultured Paludibacter sp.]|nr:transposase [uncultured Paludibacter sp.]VBB47250.1 transposase [uncultured Paludibacter sp.]